MSSDFEKAKEEILDLTSQTLPRSFPFGCPEADSPTDEISLHSQRLTFSGATVCLSINANTTNS